MDPVTMIQIKRRSERPHTDQELEYLIREYTAGTIPDYQMSAWLMAVCWRGMTDQETATLTRCMVESGARLQWNPLAGVVLADKHSTGGVGDKISLILAPLAACMGVQVPMMAGRGLGHTGGTIDKLESIPGYQTSLTVEKFQSVVQSVGCSIISPDKTLCPADRKIYALRDVTATVSSIPLQTASIMSKKIAENPQYLVLDCKYGLGSFQDSAEQAKILAHSMIATGEANGVKTTALLTHMDHPIGKTVGNWLEVYECIQMMKTGTGAKDLLQLVVIQAAQMAVPKYPDLTFEETVEKALTTLQSGQVYNKFREMVLAQGGSTEMIDQCPVNEAPFCKDILAPQNGFISKIHALIAGEAGVKLGAGRTVADQAVDFHAGIVFHYQVGDAVAEGAKVATLYTSLSEQALEQACQLVQNQGIQYSSTTVAIPPVVSHRISRGGMVEVFEMPAVLNTL